MCGIFGIYNHPDAVELTKLGLHALQHRGQESTGLTYKSDNKLKRFVHTGLVQESLAKFTDKSDICIGHTRYSTTGSSDISNAQPILAETPFGQIAVAHNGNLTNSLKLKTEFFDTKGFIAPVIFHTTSDTELILWLIAYQRKDSLLSSLKNTCRMVEGAFSLLIMTQDSLVAVRDPNGFRPLCIGRHPKNNSYAVSSETCALDITGFQFVREVKAGEIVVIKKAGISSNKFSGPSRSFCAFEHVYFSRPDSFYGKRTVYDRRRELGRQLAKEAPVDADIVTGIPDSGNYAALGYSSESGIPYELCFIRSHYIGRTFIQPTSDMRALGVKLKLSPIKSVVKGKRLIVVDDSIVRGTTVKNRISLLKESGAKEIHLRISCPPIKHPCVYGIDFPDPSELIANQKKIKDIAKYVGADSLYYLSLEGMRNVIKEASCDACWSGRYPVKPKDKPQKLKFSASSKT